MNISYIPASVRVKERSKLLTWLKKEKKESRTFKRTALVSQRQAWVSTLCLLCWCLGHDEDT